MFRVCSAECQVGGVPHNFTIFSLLNPPVDGILTVVFQNGTQLTRKASRLHSGMRQCVVIRDDYTPTVPTLV